YNFRLTNVACALLCAQLERRDQILARRHAIYATYRQQLAAVPGVILQPVAPWAELSPWMFAISIDPATFGCERDELIAFLAKQNIDPRPMFLPLHKLPPFREESLRRGEDLPITDQVSANSLMLPTYNQLSDDDVVRIVDTIARAPKDLFRFRAHVHSAV